MVTRQHAFVSQVARSDGTLEFVSILTSCDVSDLKVHHSGKVHIISDFALHPTEDRVVFAMRCVERNMVHVVPVQSQNGRPNNRGRR